MGPDVRQAAEVPPRPAPLCFVDNDPIPWASLHDKLIVEARPPAQDTFLTERIKNLPVPVIGLPPVVARRPWWLVAAIHETGHHLQYSLAAWSIVPAELRCAAGQNGGPDANSGSGPTGAGNCSPTHTRRYSAAPRRCGWSRSSSGRSTTRSTPVPRTRRPRSGCGPAPLR